MNTEPTALDTQFLRECGIAVAGGSATDEEAERAEKDEAAIYYRRIVEELG